MFYRIAFRVKLLALALLDTLSFLCLLQHSRAEGMAYDHDLRMNARSRPPFVRSLYESVERMTHPRASNMSGSYASRPEADPVNCVRQIETLAAPSDVYADQWSPTTVRQARQQQRNFFKSLLELLDVFVVRRRSFVGVILPAVNVDQYHRRGGKAAV